ncbi:uncharacterized protein KY384_000847 [Bacidia gigantensis]|uniref:uncharacterized protein n=1 Tax=Bacidia gigantensis TaxID=2732470 RepID=UPI001D04A78B|nr:uncharacterized protein KY384_000847 [Bacidia gigantensis]KAG8534005.1 hypothetical protein KY384_000847 [Bacidia gigantensis]
MTAVTTSHRGFPPSQRVSEADSDQWDFSVPDPLVNKQEQLPSHQGNQQGTHQNGTYAPSTQYQPESRKRAKPARVEGNDHFTANAPGSISKGSKKNYNLDNAYLSPLKGEFKPGSRGSRNSSEPDSLLELYGNPRGADGKSIRENTPDSKRSAFQPPPEETNDIEEGGAETSHWIHRDKLLQIEKQEMQELGISPPPAPRAVSRSKSRRERSRSTPTEGDAEGDLDARPKEDPQPDQHDPQTLQDAGMDPDAEKTASPVYRSQHLRSSSSRIPLPRSNPMSVTQNADKSTPVYHTRTASSGDDVVSYSRTRSRNNSVGSQNLLNDPLGTSSPTSPSNNTQGSPSKNRSIGRAAGHNRKPSISSPDGPKSPTPNTSRTPSASTPTIQPKSRQGLEARPPTAINRPEGEPPWIKEMYKPDPRLPPEQQMLPTHAKRLQQEQWEQARKESETRQRELEKQTARKPSNVPIEHDRDNEKNAQPHGRGFSPVAVHTRDGLQPPPPSFQDQRAASPADRDKPLPSTGHSNESNIPQASGGALSGRCSRTVRESRPLWRSKRRRLRLAARMRAGIMRDIVPFRHGCRRRG